MKTTKQDSKKVRDEKYRKRKFSFEVDTTVTGAINIIRRLNIWLTNATDWCFNNVKEELIK